jgi:hypothetical protein
MLKTSCLALAAALLVPTTSMAIFVQRILTADGAETSPLNTTAPGWQSRNGESGFMGPAADQTSISLN